MGTTRSVQSHTKILAFLSLRVLPVLVLNYFKKYKFLSNVELDPGSKITSSKIY